MIFFVIPAYNEKENIRFLLESISKKMEALKHSYRMVIVNDGSTDGTKELVESYKAKYPITLLNHSTNKNVGEVFRAGFRYVMDNSHPGDIVVTKEADNTGDLDILPAMLEKINNGYDLVLASCYAKEGKIMGTTVDRIFLSSVANLLLRLFFAIKGVRTYSSFYRCYKVEILKKAFDTYNNRFIEENGFVCMVEILVKISKLSAKITEVPMILRCDLRKGKSKMKKTATIFGYLHLITKQFKK